MENITTGHWIFAGIFLTAFIVYLVWGYRKDIRIHRMHYQKSFYVLIGIIVVLFVYYIFKRLL